MTEGPVVRTNKLLAIVLKNNIIISMLERLLGPEIVELINQNEWTGIMEAVAELLPPEIADILSIVTTQKNKYKLFRLLPEEKRIEVFPHLDDAFQALLFKRLPVKIKKNILLNLEPDDRTAILETLDKTLRLKLLHLLPKDDLKESLRLLSYPEESVGRLMTPEFMTISSNWKVKFALDHIRKQGQEKEHLSTIYITDKHNRLLDEIRLKKLILAQPNKKIEELMDYSIISLNAYEDREEAVKIMQKYDLFILPVTDNGILVGIVTFDDVMDVAEEETTEDIHKQSGIMPFEINYSSASIFKMYINRVGWLLLLLAGSFISSNIIAHFSYAIESIVALSFFIAVLIGSGGNVGTQSSALVIRAMATGDIHLKQWAKLITKEMIIGVLLGLSLGGALYLRALYMKGAHEVSFVVGTAIFFVVVWANLIGALLPFLLKKIKIDPAVVSSPLITTIIDSTGLFIYFTIAKIFLKI